jgi:hypothetical protein
MRHRTEILQHKDEIAIFLRQLPDAPVEIKGVHEKNELYINGKKISLAKSLKIRNHSPTGFNWGYGGSGPAQSALAILMEFADPALAEIFYQDFKFGWVGGLPQSDFCVNVNLRQIMADIIFK